MMSRRRKRGTSPLFGLIIFIMAAAVIIFGVGMFFSIGDIVVNGTDEEYTRDDIISASGIKEGRSLLFLNSEKAAEKIHTQFPYITSVDIVKEFPSTVTVNIVKSKACAAVNVDGVLWLVNEQLYVLERVQSAQGYILIKGLDVDEANVGKPFAITKDNDTQLTYTKMILQQLCNIGIEKDVSELDVNNIGNITFRYGRFEVKLGSGEKIEYKLSRLQGIISQLGENETGMIDLSVEGEAYFKPAQSASN